MRYDPPTIQPSEAAVPLVQGMRGRLKGIGPCRDGGHANTYTIGAYEVDE
jgi:hypothetical protein